MVREIDTQFWGASHSVDLSLWESFLSIFITLKSSHGAALPLCLDLLQFFLSSSAVPILPNPSFESMSPVVYDLTFNPFTQKLWRQVK